MAGASLPKVFNKDFGVSALALDREDFMPSDVLPLGVYDGIVECIEAEQSGVPEMKGVIDILRQIAISGFFPLRKSSDPRAELISRLYVGGVVGNFQKVALSLEFPNLPLAILITL
jgi:hypothetical protein